MVGLAVDVTTSSGLYCATAEVETDLPWHTSHGIGNVPVEEVVLLHAKEQGSYDWSLHAPDGSDEYQRLFDQIGQVLDERTEKQNGVRS